MTSSGQKDSETWSRLFDELSKYWLTDRPKESIKINEEKFYQSFTDAMKRIFSLAKNCRMADIKQDRSGYLAPDPRDKRHGRYLNDTMYYLLAPIVNVRILLGQMERIHTPDNNDIRFRYLVMKVLYDTFTEAPSLANSDPKLEYAPDRQKINENPAKFYHQGIYPRTLDIIVDELPEDGLREDGLREDGSVISIFTFGVKYGDAWRKPLPKKGESRRLDVNEALRRFSTILHHFHPRKKPVFWRVLLAQLFLYKIFEKIGKGTNEEITNLTKNVGTFLESLKTDTEIRDKIEWRQPSEVGPIEGMEVYENPLNAVVNYLSSKLQDVLEEELQRQ